MEGAGPQPTLGRVMVNCVALLSAGAAAIHFSVIRDHFAEYWAFGLFFAIAGWVQILAAMALIANASRRYLLAGAVGNLAVAAVWVISRTVGLPVGPHAGTAEAVEFIDVLATGFEAVIVVGIVLLLRGSENRVVRIRSLVATTITTALIVVALTTAAITSVSLPNEGSDVFREAPRHG